jgi:hypothetical protein
VPNTEAPTPLTRKEAKNRAVLCSVHRRQQTKGTREQRSQGKGERWRSTRGARCSCSRSPCSSSPHTRRPAPTRGARRATSCYARSPRSPSPSSVLYTRRADRMVLNSDASRVARRRSTSRRRRPRRCRTCCRRRRAGSCRRCARGRTRCAGTTTGPARCTTPTPPMSATSSTRVCALLLHLVLPAIKRLHSLNRSAETSSFVGQFTTQNVPSRTHTLLAMDVFGARSVK